MRSLSANDKKFIKELSQVSSFTWFPFLVGSIFILVGFPGMFGIDLEWGEFNFKYVYFLFWVGIIFCLFGFVLNYFWNKFTFQVPGVFSKKQLTKIMQEGDITEFTVINIYQDHQLKRGPYPLNIVILEVPGKEDKAFFGTFSTKMIAEVVPGTSVKGYYLSSIPEAFIPLVQSK